MRSTPEQAGRLPDRLPRGTGQDPHPRTGTPSPPVKTLSEARTPGSLPTKRLSPTRLDHGLGTRRGYTHRGVAGPRTACSHSCAQRGGSALPQPHSQLRPKTASTTRALEGTASLRVGRRRPNGYVSTLPNRPDAGCYAHRQDQEPMQGRASPITAAGRVGHGHRGLPRTCPKTARVDGRPRPVAPSAGDRRTSDSHRLHLDPAGCRFGVGGRIRILPTY